MGLIKKIREIKVGRKLKDTTSVEQSRKNAENKKQTIKTGEKFDVIGTAESRKMFSENPGLMKSFLEIAKEIGIITNKGIPSSYKDPRGRFSLELLKKNKIFTLGQKSTKVKYTLSTGNKKYTVLITQMDKKYNQSALDIALKSNILREAKINVIEPIKGISNRKDNKAIMVYPDYSALLPARDALSFKMREALKSRIEKVNEKLKQTIARNHEKLGIVPETTVKVSMDDFRVDPKTKKLYAVFEY